MRVAVIADVHSNAAALEAIFADVAARAVDRTIVMGDLTAGVAEPSEVIALLRATACDVVTGQLDPQVARPLSDEMRAQADNPFVGAFVWTADHLTADDRAYLLALPMRVRVEGDGVEPLVCCHNAPFATALTSDWPTSHDAAALAELFAKSDTRWIVRGHQHAQFVTARDGLTIVNVGPGGLATDGDPRVGYTLLESVAGGWRVESHRLAYDVDRAVRMIRERDFPGPDYREQLLRTGTRPGPRHG